MLKYSAAELRSIESVIPARPESFFLPKLEEGFPTSGNDNEKEIYLSYTLLSFRRVVHYK